MSESESSGDGGVQHTATDGTATGGDTAVNGAMSGGDTTTDGDEHRRPPVTATLPVARLERALAAVEAVAEECLFHFEPGALRVEATDPAQVALATVTVDAAAFDRYEADGTTVGVDAGRLSELVGVAAGDDPVTLAVDPATWHLDVRLPELSYGVAALDPDSVLSPPDREELAFPYTADCTLPVAEIERFVGAVDLVADYATLAVDPTEPAFLVRADGDTDEVSVRLAEEDLPALSPGSAESLFSLVYLDEVTRAIPGGTDVALRLGEDCPVRFEYGFADGDGTVETLVSPRIQR
ncbi:DNA polymerase [Halobaculum sp. MBLA0147]|uniref:DNA polymerase n=1 Tax=Halobaculum sp. MBLA0147 TaxID=3079934 RepID=UPI0035266E3C